MLDRIHLSPSAPSLALAVAMITTPIPSAAQGGSVLQLLNVEGRQLQAGTEHRGALSTSDYLSPQDNYLEAWTLEGRAGESATIDLLSDDFDSYLYIVGPGFGETLSDDDGGGGCNARITVRFLETGTFHIVASSAGSKQTGMYTLRVTDTPEPTPSYDCGEPNPEVLRALPTDDRSIRLGDLATGRFTGGEPTVQDGRPAQAWALEGRAGESVTVTLESTDFDAYLYLTGPGLDDLLSDDDGAGNSNSQITVTLPQDAMYLVVASSFQAGATGSYTIRVDEPIDLNTLPTEGRSIGVGEAASGQLTSADPVVMEGRRGQVWALEGETGQTVTIDLISDDFDCYLYLVGPGLEEPLSDDDSGGDFDSRINITFPENGTYRVIVSALGGNTGAFTLRVSGL